MTDRVAPSTQRFPTNPPLSAFRRRVLASWWPNVLSFVLTIGSTTLFGCALAQCFAQHRPFNEDAFARSYIWLLHGDPRFWSGLVYSVPLLLILLAHELGHYFTCRRWGVEATLPYFGPSPTLLGTIGAFIWIKSPIYSRRSLFDIGVSGPICGFILLVPFLAAGVARSQACPGTTHGALFSFGTPLLLAFFERLFIPGVATVDICLHPMAIAGWAGMLATAINLIPIGQLDGGHILYGVFGGKWHRTASIVVVILLAFAGFSYWPWWIWAVALFIFRRHPFIYDEQPLDRGRRIIAVIALLLLMVSFVTVPVRVA